MRLENYRRWKTARRFRYWIKAREEVRKKKEAGEDKPWTTDPILARYKFCNVIRQDDKVSRWLRENWIEPNKNKESLLVALCLARHFNSIPFLARIGYPDHGITRKVNTANLKSKARGEKQFSAAYMIKCGKGQSKIDYVLQTIEPIKQFVRYRGLPDHPCTMRNWAVWLTQFKGFGTFLAGQVAADLRWGIDGAWCDKDTWAFIGPGSLRGMNRYLGKPLEAPLRQEDFLEELLEIIAKQTPHLPEDLTNRMEAIDWQNCLCEFDKYERTVFDGRRPKQRYQGEE